MDSSKKACLWLLVVCLFTFIARCIAASIPAKQEPITTDDLLALRDFVAFALSPNGNRIAFAIRSADLVRNRYELSIGWADIASKTTHVADERLPVQYRENGEPVLPDLQFSPDGSSFSMSCLTSAGRNVLMWDLNKGGQPTYLLSDDSNILTHQWSPDGSKILYLVEENERPGRTEFEREGIVVQPPLPHPYAGKSLLDSVLATTSSSVPSLHVLAPLTRTVRLASQDEKRMLPGGLPFARALDYGVFGIKDDIFLATQVPSRNWETLAYAKQRHVSGTLTQAAIFVRAKSGGDEIQATPWDDTWPSIVGWIDKDRALLVERRAPERGLFRVDLTKPDIRRVWAPDGGTFASDLLVAFSCSEDGSRVAGIISSPTKPPRLVVWDVTSRVTQYEYDPNTWFAEKTVPLVEELKWENRFGESGHAYLVHPMGSVAGERAPLVITTYRASGDFLRGAVGDEYPIFPLAASGFAVLAFDVGPSHYPWRGVGEERTKRWVAPQSSIESLLGVLRDRRVYDPEKLGVCGLSYGSDLTTYLISHTTLFSAAICSGGSYDPTSSYVKGVATMPWGGPSITKSKEWSSISPANNADAIHTPLLMNVADSEYLNSIQLFAAMRERNIPTEMVIYPSENHVKNQPCHRAAIYARNIDWFRFWMLGQEDAAPSKRKQYERWRALRGAFDTGRK